MTVDNLDNKISDFIHNDVHLPCAWGVLRQMSCPACRTLWLLSGHLDRLSATNLADSLDQFIGRSRVRRDLVTQALLILS